MEQVAELGGEAYHKSMRRNDQAANGEAAEQGDAVRVFRVLSLGAGVQSSVLALRLSRGDEALAKLGYPKPDLAVFADTGWEPGYVYEHLDWLESQLDFPLHPVHAGDLKENARKAVTVTGRRFVDVPYYTVNPDGSKGALRRQCTYNYKIQPIYREMRRLAGAKPRRPFPSDARVEMWLGISTDEAGRMKGSRERWVEHRWPLIDSGWTRQDCRDWFSAEYPERHLPRSACVICPYRSNHSWLEMKRNDEESFAEAVRFDNMLRRSLSHPVRQVLSGRPYLHSSRRPLASAVADVEKSAERDSPDAFTNECEGLCGV